MALDRITVTNNFNTPSGLVLGSRDFTFVRYIDLKSVVVGMRVEKRGRSCLKIYYVYNPLKAYLQYNTSAV